MYTKPLIPFALLAIALLFGFWLFPVGLVFALWIAVQPNKAGKHDPVTILGFLSQFALSLALAIDIFGNSICGPMLNRVAIAGQREHYPFGTPGETISRALGMNQDRYVLSRFGRTLASVLDSIQPEHCRLAAGLPATGVVLSGRVATLNRVLAVLSASLLIGLTVYGCSR